MKEDFNKNAPEIADILNKEERRQRDGIVMIPSENYVSGAVLDALGSVFTNKYAEGYPGKRYYGGNEFTDELERLTCERAKNIFKCEHANVQPLSGSPANQAVYFAFLEPGDTVLAMDYSHGGHLTHGHPISHMGKVFNFVQYKTDTAVGGTIDFEEVYAMAKEHKPKIILVGHSSYPREYDYQTFRDIADKVGAIAMADIAHTAGLIAAGVMKNPFDYGFDIVTTTTHKTLRGPRGGMILCKEKFAAEIDRSVFPGLQGGPHMNNIAGLCVALGEVLKPEFKDYAAKILSNAKVLAETLTDKGVTLVTGGTENHLMVVDTVKSFDVNGAEAEKLLDKVGISVNKQVIPDDPNPPLKPSGIRLGTPAATTRGMEKGEMKELAGYIYDVLSAPEDSNLHAEIGKKVRALCSKFAVPGLNQAV